MLEEVRCLFFLAARDFQSHETLMMRVSLIRLDLMSSDESSDERSRAELSSVGDFEKSKCGKMMGRSPSQSHSRNQRTRLGSPVHAFNLYKYTRTSDRRYILYICHSI